MRLTILLFAMLVKCVPAGLAENHGSSLVRLESADGASHLVIDVRSARGTSLVKKWMHKDSFASVDLLDQPFVLVASPCFTNASGWKESIFREDGSFNEALGEQFVFHSSSALKEVLGDVLEKYKKHNVYLVLSKASSQRLSMGTLPRLCESHLARGYGFCASSQVADTRYHHFGSCRRYLVVQQASP